VVSERSAGEMKSTSFICGFALFGKSHIPKMEAFGKHGFY